MDPPQQKSGVGIRKFETKVQEDQVGEQSEKDKKSEQSDLHIKSQIFWP